MSNLPPRTSNTDPAAPWNQCHDFAQLESAEVGPFGEILITTDQGTEKLWPDDELIYDDLCHRHGMDYEIIAAEANDADITITLVVAGHRVTDTIEWEDWRHLFE